MSLRAAASLATGGPFQPILIALPLVSGSTTPLIFLLLVISAFLLTVFRGDGDALEDLLFIVAGVFFGVALVADGNESAFLFFPTAFFGDFFDFLGVKFCEQGTVNHSMN